MAGRSRSPVEPLRRPRPCPVCDKPSTRPHYPFCSQACADADLSQWLGQGYSIPGDEVVGASNGGDED